jgi:hypothetical protein
MSRTDTITRRRRSASRAAVPGLTDRRAEGRRRAAWIGATLAVAVIAGVAYQAWPRHDPTWVDAPRTSGPVVELGTPPAQYRAVWRVDAGNPLGSTVRTEVLEVRRPWQSRLTTLEGAPPGGRVTDVQVGDFGKLVLQPVGEAETVLVLQPDLAPSDLRLDVDLPHLVKAGGVEVRERRRVGGEPCQVYRTTAPPQGQTIDKLPSKTGDVVDTCVDADGIVREQLVFFNDELLLRRRATDVDLDPGIGRHELDVTDASTVPVDLGGGAVAAVAPNELPADSYRLDDVPAGFRSEGIFAVVPSAPPTGNGIPSGNRRSSFVDVWTDGVDVLLLDQGGLTFAGDALGPNSLSSSVDVGPLGTARGAPGARFSQVAISKKDGTYVRVLGTLPVARLAELMGSLRRGS